MTYTFPTGYLSVSQIDKYIKCPACYELQYVQKMRAPTSIDALIGRSFHTGVEAARRDILTGTHFGLLDEYVDETIATFNSEVTNLADPESGAEIVLDMGRNFKTIGEARDMAAKLAQEGLPQLIQLDHACGLVAVEQRVMGLGLPWDQQEVEYQQRNKIEPIFPFKVYARLDALYKNNTIRDVKTAGKKGDPTFANGLQLALEMAPWLRAGVMLQGAIDRIVKYKDKPVELTTYWVSVDQEKLRHARDLVLQVAEGISAGRFPPRPDWSCNFDHNLPSFRIAVEGGEGADGRMESGTSEATGGVVA